MAYNADAQRRYNEKGILFAVKFTQRDAPAARAYAQHIASTGKTVNAYLKELIYDDMRKNGITPPEPPART